MTHLDDFGLWMKTRYLLKNLDEEILRDRQNELLDIVGGLRAVLLTFVDSLPRPTLAVLCKSLYAPQTTETSSPSPGPHAHSELSDHGSACAPAVTSNSSSALQDLPDEMLHLVCNYLNVIDLKNIQQTCSQFAIVGRQDLSVKPALQQLNDLNNNVYLKCSVGFKQEIVSLIQTDNMALKFLHLSSLIAANAHKHELLIQHGIIGKLVELLKYDNKKCNFKYKYEAMRILIDLFAIDRRRSKYTHVHDEEQQKHGTSAYAAVQYLREVCEQYDVLSAFQCLCQSDPVCKLLHYYRDDLEEIDDGFNVSFEEYTRLNKNDKLIMESDRDIIRAFRWDTNIKRWRECGSGYGRVSVYQNVNNGMHKFIFVHATQKTLKLLQYVDNMNAVRWNQNDGSIYWTGDDYCLHTNGTWKLKFSVLDDTRLSKSASMAATSRIMQQAIQLYDCFNTYANRQYQTVGAKIMQQLDHNNIFDHFYWLNGSLQQHIVHILQSDEPQLNMSGLQSLYNALMHMKKHNQRSGDQIQHIIACGVLHKIVRTFVSPLYHEDKGIRLSIKIVLALLNVSAQSAITLDIDDDDDDNSSGGELMRLGSITPPPPFPNTTLSSSSSTLSEQPRIEVQNEHILSEYRVTRAFYRLLHGLNEDSEVLQDTIEWFGILCVIPEQRRQMIALGVLRTLFERVMDFNAIIQSVTVLCIRRFFRHLTAPDFQAMRGDTLAMIPNVLMNLLDKSMDYDDYEMQQQLLLAMECFCDGENSESRSRLIVRGGCLRYIGNLLHEMVKSASPKKKHQHSTFDGIESSCIRIIGNVLCDCIWSDFEQQSMDVLQSVHYLQTVHLLLNGDDLKFCRDILWSLSNVLNSTKGISWLIEYEPIIFDLSSIATVNSVADTGGVTHYATINVKTKCDTAWNLCTAFSKCTKTQKALFLKSGFMEVLLSLIGINEFEHDHKQKQTMASQLEKIMKANISTHKNKTKKKEIEQCKDNLQHVLQHHSDPTYFDNLKKIFDLIESVDNKL